MTSRPAIAERAKANNKRIQLLALMFCWVLGAAYTYHYLDRGWIPHDEGTLAHSAERVLNGELPHRDFAEVYTGGLSYFHSWAFRFFGTDFLAIRYALFGVVLLWIPAFYYAASRVASPPVASVATVISVFWSVPNYPAAMPSWYNLFLATFGLSALLAYTSSPKRRWLVVAGVAGGLSVLVKTTGLFFIGAGVLGLIFNESQKVQDHITRRPRAGVVALAELPVVLAAVALIGIGVSRREWEDFYQFALPGLAVSLLVGKEALRLKRASRPVEHGAAVLTFLVSAAVPVLLYTSIYVVAGAVPELMEGVFELPLRRFSFAALVPPRPYGIVITAVIVFLIADLRRLKVSVRAFQSGAILALLVLSLSPLSADSMQPFVWQSLVQATPVVVLALVMQIGRTPSDAPESPRRKAWTLVASVAAFCSLIQYPFAGPIYFSYSMPFLVLAILVVVQHAAIFRPRAWKALGLFYGAYGAIYVSPMAMAGLTGGFKSESLATLDIPRGGLRISPTEAIDYQKMVLILNSRAKRGTIYAGPDSPELYFLTGLRNPTRAFFDFLVPDSIFYRRLTDNPDSAGISAVAINTHTVHSPPLDDATLAAFARAFPQSERHGRFLIRWRP